MEIVKNIAHKLLLYLFRTFFEATENIWWLTASCSGCCSPFVERRYYLTSLVLLENKPLIT